MALMEILREGVLESVEGAVDPSYQEAICEVV